MVTGVVEVTISLDVVDSTPYLVRLSVSRHIEPQPPLSFFLDIPLSQIKFFLHIAAAIGQRKKHIRAVLKSKIYFH